MMQADSPPQAVHAAPPGRTHQADPPPPAAEPPAADGSGPLSLEELDFRIQRAETIAEWSTLMNQFLELEGLPEDQRKAFLDHADHRRKELTPGKKR
jgi:hypothetical protein